MHKFAHHYDPKTLLYTHSSKLKSTTGYKDPLIPQCALSSDIPSYDTDTQELKANVTTGKWEILDKKIKITAYHKKTQAQKEFEDESLIDDEYTAIKPSSGFDEFIDGEWVLNEGLKFATEEHGWVVSELAWYDSKVIYAARGDTSRSGGYTKEELDTYAIALCDYTSKDVDGNITVKGNVRPVMYTA